MPTEKPRVTFTIEENKLGQIKNYQFEHKIRNQTQAILSLIEKGLADLEQISDTPAPSKKAPSYSDGAIKLAKDYDTLDRWGKQALRELADTEIARMEDESRFLVETTLEPEPKIIPLYLTPAAAGYASPVFGEDYEDYTLTPDDPQGADFAVRLQGDSMEPYFPDGEVVFCNRNPLADGDIGVFVVDGTAVCKQYHKEGGVVYLFSLNRKRADADVVLLPSGGQTLVCQGRVITKRRYPLPGK